MYSVWDSGGPPLFHRQLNICLASQVDLLVKFLLTFFFLTFLATAMCSRRKKAGEDNLKTARSIRAVLTVGKKGKAIGMDSGSIVEEVKMQSEETGNKTKPPSDLGEATEKKKPQTSPPTKPELPQNQQAKSPTEAERLEHGGDGYENFGPPQESAPEAAATEAAAICKAQPIAPVIEVTRKSDKSRQKRRSKIERLFTDKTQDFSGRGHMAKALRTKRSEVAV
ncbi:hypothetical protein ANCCAN_10614 [Ancylostoma caninum]|uniref:Uncharacterized protein n=1 Tax=Ancylostoma caninum TaxID=29170 RepID=A0A368GGA8_ANCCA|nr:hypothetical protein ANCCAN_10614 [Ancylostoma caninum]